jgi:hypothetical protein
MPVRLSVVYWFTSTSAPGRLECHRRIGSSNKQLPVFMYPIIDSDHNWIFTWDRFGKWHDSIPVNNCVSSSNKRVCSAVEASCSRHQMNKLLQKMFAGQHKNWVFGLRRTNVAKNVAKNVQKKVHRRHKKRSYVMRSMQRRNQFLVGGECEDNYLGSYAMGAIPKCVIAVGDEGSALRWIWVQVAARMIHWQVDCNAAQFYN